MHTFLWEFEAFDLCKPLMLTLHLHIDTLAWYVIEMMYCLLTKPVCTGSFPHFYHWQGVMTDLWLISVPLDKTSITSVEKLRQTIDRTNLASCFMFSIPDLKVRFSCRVKPRWLDGRKTKEIARIVRACKCKCGHTVHQESVAETGVGVWCPSPVKSGGSSCSWQNFHPDPFRSYKPGVTFTEHVLKSRGTNAVELLGFIELEDTVM